MTNGKTEIDDLLKTRYSRQVLFAGIGKEGQQRIMSSRVLLVGCGGLGTILADILVRAGVGFVRIVDRDFVEESNLQRQVLFDVQDVEGNMPKAEAAKRRLQLVNPHVTVEAVVADVDSTNISAMVKDVDLIMDGTDNFEIRYLINDAAVKFDKPWIYGGAVGSDGMCSVIIPGNTPCFRCIYDSPPPPGTAPTCDNSGVLASIIHIIASMQASEALKILSGNADKVIKGMVYADVWEGQYRTVRTVSGSNSECEACGKRNFTYLNAERGSFVTSMCGRNAVQISWKEKHELDLNEIAAKLKQNGEVAVNRFLLKFKCDEAAITLFPDGRAVIEGTNDTERAREIYSKFIG